ncbi:MAG: hypothetical protein P9M06_01225 [Candidatus Saelkia tenebricola]|nr:hypothetical protein [Candidatus Saelkia tenebricola]
MKRYAIVFITVVLLGFLFGIYFVGTPQLRAGRVTLKKIFFNEDDTLGFKLSPGAHEIRIQNRKQEWKKDPFTASSIEEFSGKIHLEAISIDVSGEGIAMINGEFYREGGILGVYRIVKIDEDYVVVEEDGNNITVKLEEDKNNIMIRLEKGD